MAIDGTKSLDRLLSDSPPISLGESIERLVSIIHAAKIDRCLQCHKCSSGCPMASKMEILPSQVVRLIQLGLTDDLIASRTIWICASCQTCVTRCPAGVDLAKAQDMLRQHCLEKGVSPADRRVALAHDAFLNTVERFGRLHEIRMIALYKRQTKTLFERFNLGIKLLYKRKLKLIGKKIKGRRQTAAIIAAHRLQPAEKD